MLTPGNSLEPCDQFALVADFDEYLFDCAVCGRLQITHERSDQRTLTLAQAKAARLSIIEDSARTLTIERLRREQ